jgi:2-dehydro-3-deoxygalactonokinase
MKDDENREQFLSCDWGTSSFRLRLIDVKNNSVLTEIRTSDGIADIFQSWKQRNESEDDRKAFYLNYLFQQAEKIKASRELANGLPIVISGMISSSIGMIELPYKEIPFKSDGSDLILYHESYNQHPLFIISGVSSDDEVMRGEETMLVGCETSNSNEDLFIFPGTHSKHILVSNGIAKNFKTYMTGEVFHLLCNKSILSASVKEIAQMDSDHFKKGVIEGSSSNLLNSIFHVRTNQLFKKVTAEENYHYLSGLLIGYELKAITEKKLSAITLVCSGNLKELYLSALETVDLKNMQCVNADEALINGQCKILKMKAT